MEDLRWHELMDNFLLLMQEDIRPLLLLITFLHEFFLVAKTSYLKRPVAKSVDLWLVKGFMLFV